MNPTDWEYQAAHFDEKSPFAPFPQLLRATGFRYSYILKEVVINQAIGSLALKPGSKILDIGCGHGILLDRIGAHVPITGIGVDVSTASLKKARDESVHCIEVVAADGRYLPFAHNSFHGSLSMDTLEHIEDPENLIDEMVRVTTRGGKVVCYAVSARNRWTFNWLLMSIFDWVGLDHWSWRAHDPELLVDPQKTYEKFEEVGCKIDKFEPFHAFFTIMLDIAILALLWSATKLGRFKSLRKSEDTAGRWLLSLTSVISRAMLSPLRAMDIPWIRRSLSNGFLIAASKVHDPRTESTVEGISNPLEVPLVIDPPIVAPIGRSV